MISHWVIGTVVNQTLHFTQGSSLEITPTVHLKVDLKTMIKDWNKIYKMNLPTTPTGSFFVIVITFPSTNIDIYQYEYIIEQQKIR